MFFSIILNRDRIGPISYDILDNIKCKSLDRVVIRPVPFLVTVFFISFYFLPVN